MPLPPLEYIIKKPESNLHTEKYTVDEGNFYISRLYKLVKFICKDKKIKSKIIEKNYAGNIKRILDIEIYEGKKNVGHIKYNNGQIDLYLELNDIEQHKILNSLIKRFKQ